MRIFLLVCCCMTLSQLFAATRFDKLSFAALSHISTENNADRVALALSLQVDSVHHVDCLHTHGYLKVSGTGGTAPYSYIWSNGNTGAVGANLEKGDYTITVADAEGDEAQLVVTIEEDFTPPFADAGENQQVTCSSEKITLTGNGSLGSEFSYSWTPSVGSQVHSGGHTLSPLVSGAGQFTLIVTNLNNGCTAIASAEVNAVHQSPTANVTGGDLGCNQSVVTLGASYTTLNAAVQWTGPNNFVSNLPNPVVSIAGNYVFVVTDTVTNCAFETTATVNAGPTATVSGGGFITCAQASVTLYGAGSPQNISYGWSGPGGFSSVQQNPSVTAPGVYTLKVTQLSSGCTATATISVGSNIAYPTVLPGTNGTLTCTVNSVQLFATVNPVNSAYQWSGPNGFHSSATTQQVSVAGVYTLTVTNPDNGCTAAASTNVVANIAPPGATATGGSLTCTSPTVTLQANTATMSVIYSWKGPGNFSSNQKSPVVNTSGTYTVTITNTVNSCTSTAVAIVSQNLTPPTINATSATVTCLVPTPKVTATSQVSGATFTWSGPNGFTSNIYNPAVSAGGYYTVTVTNPANGCTNGTTIYVDENTTPPVAVAGPDRSLNCKFSIILMNPFGTSTGSNYTYLWTTDEGNLTTTPTTLYARADAPGIYKITVKNTQNGCTSFDEMEIIQSPAVTANAFEQSIVTCNGTATGSVKVTATGVPSLNYLWSNGASTATVNNLVAGTYTVTVTDAEGCTVTSVATVTQPAVLAASVSTTHQTMAGVNNGSATVAATGGSAPYNYKWNTNAISATINNLAPGTYTVTVTDNQGCTKVQIGTVNSVSCAVSGSVTPTNVTCSGSANGTATANLNGANGTVNYIWSNGGNTKTISNLGPGNYTVTATDNNGCTIVLTTQVTSPQPLALSLGNQTNILCVGQTGAATMNASGGTSPFTFSWSNGATTQTASNLNAATYTCTTTDSKGCTAKQSVQIKLTDVNPPQLSLKNATVSLNSTGFVNLTPAMFDNGSVDLECSINSWTISPTIFDCEQLGVRTVTLTATDKNGNTATGTAQATVVDNTAPVITCPQGQTVSACASTVFFPKATVTDNCSVANNSITLTAGMPSGSSFPVGATQQTYTYSDFGGNTVSCNFTITVLAPFDAAVTAAPATCTTACNGSATASVTNGSATYHWSNGQTAAVATNLCQGIYTVTITDQMGCTQVRQVNVDAGNAPGYAVNINATQASCAGSCDANAQIFVTGGAGFPAIQWSNGQSGSTGTDLCQGMYEVTLTDPAGCSQMQQVQIGFHDIQAPNVICPSNIIRGNCQTTVVFDQPQVFDNCIIDLQQLQQTGGLASGAVFPEGVTTQSFNYTDTGGNTGQCSFTVTILSAATVQISSTQTLCPNSCNGTASVVVTNGQAPFGFAWSNGMSNSSILNLCGGTYTVTISESNGCTQVQTVTVNQPTPITITVDDVVNDAGGVGSGSISVSISGGTAPYTYLWTRNGQLLSFAQDITGLTAGLYNLVVTDANGCTVSGTSVTISTTVATGEAAQTLESRIYPNPAHSEVFIQMGANDVETVHLQIFDMQGKQLRETDIMTVNNEPVRIDIEDLQTGILMFHLTDGIHTVVKKVVKQ